MRRTILIVMVLAGFAAGRAEARGTSCMGRVWIDAVFQQRMDSLRHAYFFTIRNATNQRLLAEVGFSGFPADVTLMAPTLPNVPLEPEASLSPNPRFGIGTNRNINLQTVRIAVDGAAGSGPTIHLRNCRRW